MNATLLSFVYAMHYALCPPLYHSDFRIPPSEFKSLRHLPSGICQLASDFCHLISVNETQVI